MCFPDGVIPFSIGILKIIRCFYGCVTFSPGCGMSLPGRYIFGRYLIQSNGSNHRPTTKYILYIELILINKLFILIVREDKIKQTTILLVRRRTKINESQFCWYFI